MGETFTLRFPVGVLVKGATGLPMPTMGEGSKKLNPTGTRHIRAGWCGRVLRDTCEAFRELPDAFRWG